LGKNVVLHEFNGLLSAQEIMEIGRRYIRKTFIKHDVVGKPTPFCHTEDGIPVYYKTTYYKLICREDSTDSIRKVDPQRVRRLHWIKHIICGDANNVLMKDDSDKRRYFIKPLKYLIVLKHHKNELQLITAYWITERGEYERVCKQVGLK
jgi:hypothetical protein